MRRYLLRYSRAPGDDLVFSAFVRDLWHYFQGRIEIYHTSRYGDLWLNNPYCTKWAPSVYAGQNLQTVTIYPRDEVQLLQEVRNGRILHYVAAFHEIFFRKTGLRIPVGDPRPDLHLTDEERSTPLVEPPYWVIVPGGKKDMTNKIWPDARYQRVVDILRGYGYRFVQEGALNKDTLHPRLTGVTQLLGLTSIREMIRNIYHSEGVICGVTLPMHIAGALEKPCVVLGGGRESPCFEEYSNNWPGAFGSATQPVRVPHRFLHTVGLLPCCRAAGCWLRRVVPLGDRKRSPSGNQLDSSLCQLPTTSDQSQIVAGCMDLIQVAHVVEAVLSYGPRSTLASEIQRPFE